MLNLNLVTMKNRLLLIIVLLSVSNLVSGQGKPAYVGRWYQETARGKNPVRSEILESAPSDFQRNKRYNLRANVNQLNSILRTRPELLNLTIPYGDRTYTLNLARVTIAEENMNVRTNGGSIHNVESVHYRGIVNGDTTQLASVSLFPRDISGFFSTDEGNFVITKEGVDFVVYNDQLVTAPTTIVCQTPNVTYQVPAVTTLYEGIGCKVVKIYFECDYAMYQSFGSNITNVSNYVMGFFNQVATLYANENIAVQVSQIFVWTTPDPYVSQTSTGNILNAFRTNRGTSYNGNLAHFLTTRSVGGGVAYINTLCNKAYGYGVSQVHTAYNNFPTYSWTVQVVAHELGHNLGSPHTHSCSWSSGPLDNCYTPEGGCTTGPAPLNGGTVMSYCHTKPTGINFNNGFGLQPGNLIRQTVSNAACITATTTPAPGGLTATNLTASSATLSWAATGGASYSVQFRPAAATTWISAGNTSGTSRTISGLSAGTAYVWQVKSQCSGWSANGSFTTTGGTTTTTTTCATPSQLASSNLSQTGATLSWSASPGATGYTVQYRSASATSWTSINTTGNAATLSGLAAGTSYVWQVKANCSPYSAQASFSTANATTTTTTTGCSKATNLGKTQISRTSVRLNWTGAGTAQSYTVRIRASGSNTWTAHTTATNYINLTLQPSLTYEWNVDTKCTNGVSSGYSSSSWFVMPN